MLFGRRDPATLGEKVRIALWPRRSWQRSVRYIAYRVRRLRGSPRAIAFGFACGAFVSFTPFVGFHFLMAAALAYIGRGSLIASAFGTFVGNPLTFPFIWVSTYKLGNWMLGQSGEFSARQLNDGFKTLWEGIQTFSSDTFVGAGEVLWPLIKPMTIGALPLGAVAGVLIYVLLLRVLRAAHARVLAAAPDDKAEKTEPPGATAHV